MGQGGGQVKRIKKEVGWFSNGDLRREWKQLAEVGRGRYR
jgi:hypothetical protein